MGLLITNQVSTSVGQDMTNVWGFAVFYTNTVLVDGIVQVDLSFFKSEAEKDAGADRVYPIGNDTKVVNTNIQVLPADVIKNSGVSKMSDVVSFFYNKLKTKLEEDYGWTITIQ
jgi:hypothetical protein